MPKDVRQTWAVWIGGEQGCRALINGQSPGLLFGFFKQFSFARRFSAVNLFRSPTQKLFETVSVRTQPPITGLKPTVLIRKATGFTSAGQLSVGPIKLRYWSQDNLSVSVPQFEHDGVTDLNRVLLTVDTDDEVNGRGLLRGRLGRRRRNYNLLSGIGSAR